MKRIRTIGLCFIAAFALSAFVATGAQAAKHTNMGPVVVSGEGGLAKLSSSALPAIECKKNSGTGAITGVTSNEEIVTFTECSTAGKKCGNIAAGTIKTDELTTTLGWIKAPTSVGVEFGPKTGTEDAAFECEGLKVKVTGTVIGHVSPLNSMEIHSTIALFGSSFKQEPTDLEGGTADPGADVLTAHIEGVGEAESLQENTDTTTNAAQKYKCKVKKGVETCKEAADPAEVRTTSGTPEYGRCRVSKKKGLYTDANCTVAEVPAKPGDFDGGFEWYPVPS
jgi:hypothetical protein